MQVILGFDTQATQPKGSDLSWSVCAVIATPNVPMALRSASFSALRFASSAVMFDPWWYSPVASPAFCLLLWRQRFQRCGKITFC